MFRVPRSPISEVFLRFNVVRRLYQTFDAKNMREARGLRLMRQWLSINQRGQFDTLGHFEVVGHATGKHYRIYHHVLPPNVFEVDDAGRHKMSLCFAPLGQLVKGDIMLAQKIALETDEQNVLALANSFPVNQNPVAASLARTRSQAHLGTIARLMVSVLG
jgi:hypothetical protein